MAMRTMTAPMIMVMTIMCFMVAMVMAMVTVKVMLTRLQARYPSTVAQDLGEMFTGKRDHLSAENKTVISYPLCGHAVSMICYRLSNCRKKSALGDPSPVHHW